MRLLGQRRVGLQVDCSGDVKHSRIICLIVFVEVWMVDLRLTLGFRCGCPGRWSFSRFASFEWNGILANHTINNHHSSL